MNKLIKFLISGGSAAVIEFLSFSILVTFVLINMHTESHIISFLLGAIVSFYLNKKWVFKSDGRYKTEIVQYFLLAILNLILGSILIYLLTDVLLMNEFLAKIIVMGSVATWNFIIMQKIIFKVVSVRPKESK